jgi:regulator of replication initiation timing
MLTPEEKKIKRLEKQVKDLKASLEYFTEENRKHKDWLTAERRWRKTFQSLMKDAVQEDCLPNADTMWYY